MHKIITIDRNFGVHFETKHFTTVLCRVDEGRQLGLPMYGELVVQIADKPFPGAKKAEIKDRGPWALCRVGLYNKEGEELARFCDESFKKVVGKKLPTHIYYQVIGTV